MKLTDIASVIDSLHSTPDYRLEGFPMVRVVDVNNEFIKLEKCFKVDESTFIKHNKNHIPQKGDIIITRVGSFGLLGYVDTDKKFCLGQNIAIIHPKINSKFLYYYLLSPYIQSIIHGNIGGSAYKSISLADIRNLPYSDINLDVDKIGNLLYSLDSKIELNNRINAELETMAKTLYDYWFVQFDFPVVTSNGVEKPYKTSGGKMVWNEELKREIPEGWEVKTLISLCDRIGDGIHGTPQYVDESDYFFINGNNLSNGFINTSKETKNVSSDEYQKYFIELNEGTILLSINGTLGNLAIYTDEKVMLGKSSAFINCKKNYRPFCYQYLKLDSVQKKFWNIATGSTIKNLSLDSIKNLLLLFPGDVLIDKYFDLAKPIEDKRKNIFKENQQLTELRDWLLPMLMNGQVTVNEAKEYTLPNETLSMVAEGE